jgi:hypothetical protein
MIYFFAKEGEKKGETKAYKVWSLFLFPKTSLKTDPPGLEFKALNPIARQQRG